MHQIHKQYDRVCKRCMSVDEDVEHIFLGCVKAGVFRDRLKMLLNTHCNVAIMSQGQWDWFFWFGLTESMTGVNVNLVNLL